jgi:5-hmdU DNA kinase-like protein
MHTEEFVKFILERERIRVAREVGQPWPWTDDPILRQYKFTNIHRENDRVTRWLASNWRLIHASDPDLWFAFTVFRRGLNWPDTAIELGYPIPWDPAHYVDVCRQRKVRGERVFESGAYKLMVSHALSKKLEPYASDAAEQQVRCIFNPIWARRDYYRPKPTDTLTTLHARLITADGMGSFQAAQVLADLKYVQLTSTPDWWTFAASGPGSRRGLNRVLGRPVDAEWDEAEWFANLRRLQSAIDPLAAAAGISGLHGQDTQNALCEFDKYERVRLGEGKVRPYTPPQLE